MTSGTGRPDYLRAIERAECLRLLGQRGLGRIGVVVRGRPAIFPVNYAVLDDAILICLRRGGDLDRATANSTVAFEIDGRDNVYHEGWSVLVVGRCVQVPDAADVVEQVERLGLSPWPGGERSLYGRISIEEVTGRRIRHSSA